MTDDDRPTKQKPDRGAEATAREAERRERLAAALRENLRKRKQKASPKTSSGGDGGAGS